MKMFGISIVSDSCEARKHDKNFYEKCHAFGTTSRENEELSICISDITDRSSNDYVVAMVTPNLMAAGLNHIQLG